MFAGRYEYAIDDKSRVSIPAKFRETLSTNYDMRLILTNLDGCIVGYPYQEWLSIQERTSSPGAIRKRHVHFSGIFTLESLNVPIDRLGRILIPQALKTDAQVKKNVVIIGMGKKIEIWAQERWDELVKKATADPDQIADIVSELGL